MDTKTIKLLNYPIYICGLESIPLDKKIIINTLNSHSYRIAKKDSLFSTALNKSDFLIPDGISIVFGIRFLYRGIKIKKIAGYDLFIYLMNYLNENKQSCFFIGSSEKTLLLIKEKCSIDFPNISVNCFSPPFKNHFSKKENLTMIKKINDFNPYVLFVGMTAPKQEKWAYVNKDIISAKVICPVGAVFDFYAETVKRPPSLMIKLNLEWFGRLIKEPKRMWRRYIISTPIFFYDLLKLKFKK